MITVMEHIDRRIRRTKKLLGDALIALALEKDFDDVTIQEITDRADIGYRTFFRHYADKEELLIDVLGNIRMEMQEFIGPPPVEQFLDPEIQDMAQIGKAMNFNHVQLFRHVQDNQDLYRVLLFGKRDLIQPMKDFAIQEFKKNYVLQLETPVPFEILINHTVSSMVTLIRWWLESDMSYTPEEMGEFAFRLIILPIRDTVIEGLSK